MTSHPVLTDYAIEYPTLARFRAGEMVVLDDAGYAWPASMPESERERCRARWKRARRKDNRRKRAARRRRGHR